jgi:hypothetical protein
MDKQFEDAANSPATVADEPVFICTLGADTDNICFDNCGSCCRCVKNQPE